MQCLLITENLGNVKNIKRTKKNHYNPIISGVFPSRDIGLLFFHDWVSALTNSGAYTLWFNILISQYLADHEQSQYY